MYILHNNYLLLDKKYILNYKVVMYIAEVPTKTKTGKISHKCILLRESYREDGKVKNRTIANLTHHKANEIEAIRLALKHKDNLRALGSIKEDVELKEGKSIGAAWLIYEGARRLGIEKALGKDRAGKLALWQVMARAIDQGSRLSAVRLAQTHAACDILGMRRGFDENDLYENLAWLDNNQRKIEKRLFRARNKGVKSDLFLYDVTSIYMEGMKNELAEWGYNRDKKAGKKQVVVGLLCDEEGEPVSIEVFKGSSRDFETFGKQIKKVSKEFGCKRVTFVGDRGMIKSGQIEKLKDNFYYITAITKPQIEKLVKKGAFQMELFDEYVYEVEYERVRYILRRNPYRAKEMGNIRREKKERMNELCQSKNIYLAEHPRAKVVSALREINKKIENLKLDRWLKVEADGRRLELREEREKKEEESKLDGCYVIKSDLPMELGKQTIHDRYKDLSKVEKAFRTCKTSLLEMRPWYVRTEESTRGHALVVMLAYLITHYLQEAWVGFDLTVEEGIKQLCTLCSMEMVINGSDICHHIPTPRRMSVKLLNAADVRLPEALPCLGAHVVIRKKLPPRRIAR